MTSYNTVEIGTVLTAKWFPDNFIMDREFIKQVKRYLNGTIKGKIIDRENAYHGLLELGQESVPVLISIYKSSLDIEIKRKIVDVIWEYRLSGVAEFLGDVLRDETGGNQIQAIQGLVSLGSIDALGELTKSRDTFKSSIKSDLLINNIDEAMEQLMEDLV